jgi:hypothetical protein
MKDQVRRDRERNDLLVYRHRSLKLFCFDRLIDRAVFDEHVGVYIMSEEEKMTGVHRLFIALFFFMTVMMMFGGFVMMIAMFVYCCLIRRFVVVVWNHAMSHG